MERPIVVNGREVSCDDANVTLVDLLRSGGYSRGTKIACSSGECGACTVLDSGKAIAACVTPAQFASIVETVEAVAEEALEFRTALAKSGGFQCGFCTPGIVVRAVALLRQGLPEDDAELRRELSGNICRCTGYGSIIRALRNAASGAVSVVKE